MVFFSHGLSPQLFREMPVDSPSGNSDSFYTRLLPGINCPKKSNNQYLIIYSNIIALPVKKFFRESGTSRGPAALFSIPPERFPKPIKMMCFPTNTNAEKIRRIQPDLYYHSGNDRMFTADFAGKADVPKNCRLPGCRNVFSKEGLTEFRRLPA